jgi:hypothetical protein
MDALAGTLAEPGGEELHKLVDAFLDSYSALPRSEYPLRFALPALFDLAASAEYAREMVADGSWVYCPGDTPADSAAYFPYLKSCPRCSVVHGQRPKVSSNKPGSDPIGRISANVTAVLLECVAKRVEPKTRVLACTNRSGDVDIVLAGGPLAVLAEVKSSPLAVIPLEVKLGRRLTDVKGGELAQMSSHDPTTVLTDTVDISMYLPHAGLRIPLGPTGSAQWPYTALRDYVSSATRVVPLLQAWRTLYGIYDGSDKDPEHATYRWALCGCGSTVDDSKNAPGMDRTDDLKKGTYQVLKFGTYYKEKCPRRILRAAIISNIMPVHTWEPYMAEVSDVLWTKDAYVKEASKGMRLIEERGLFSLYDALIGLNYCVWRDPLVHRTMPLDSL